MSQEEALRVAYRALRMVDASDQTSLQTDATLDAVSAAVALIEARPAVGLPVPQHVRPGREWHEDHGPALWWRFPIEEAPWCGRPLDSDWPGYHRWWTPLPPVPLPPSHLMPRIERMEASRSRRIMEDHLLDMEYMPANASRIQRR